MRMSVNPESKLTGRIELILEHADEFSTWRVTPYNKKVFIEEFDVCEHINAYWNSLPLARQQKIYEIYVQIYNVFQQFFQTDTLMLALRPLIEKLYREHSIEDIDRWMAYHAQNIHIPSTIMDEYVVDDQRPGNREKTYTKPDYVHLIGLSLTLRPMIPIWGEFIERTQKETGTMFKEYCAYLLLADTKLNESAAMEKLLIYINSNIKQDDKTKSKNSTLIVDGLGTEDYDYWLLGALLVFRISVGDIRGSETSTNLVVTAYKYITSRIAGSNGNSAGNFGEQIRDKDFRSTGSEDPEISPVEAYKIKAQLPQGAIAPFEHFLSDPERVAKIIYPQVDLQLLKLLLTHTHTLMNEQIWPCQIFLTQWVIKPAMSPRALQHLDKLHTLRAIAIAQTVLLQKKHTKLAGLVTASASLNSSNQMYSGVGSMARIPKETAEKISELYPFKKVSANRTKTQPPNTVIQAIDSLADMFNMRDWILTLPDPLASELIGNSTSRRYPCPHDIKICLANLVVEIAQRL